MIGIIISLILIVLAIATPVTMIVVKKWEEVFIIISSVITVLAIINLILILSGIY